DPRESQAGRCTRGEHSPHAVWGRTSVRPHAAHKQKRTIRQPRCPANKEIPGAPRQANGYARIYQNHLKAEVCLRGPLGEAPNLAVNGLVRLLRQMHRLRQRAVAG
ncbi:MAG: hypothetical protein ACRETL_15920, partial [Gammaproteobacteria bacterium]